MFSCVNSINSGTENNYNSHNPNSSVANQYATISGNYSTSGAVPSKVISNRTALPAFGSANNDVRYYAKATADGEETVTGTVNTTDRNYKITGLKLNTTWTVEVGIEVKVTVDGTETWVRCFYDETEPVLITKDNLTINKNLMLKPVASGTGFINLQMTVDSTISSLSIILEDEEQSNKWNAAVTADSNKIIQKDHVKLSNVPAGIYEITMLFYKSGNAYPVFSTVQTINVIAGMTTDTWKSEGDTTGIITDSDFNLTDTLITKYVDSCIYVGQNAAATSIGVTAANTNEGRAYSPLATVSEAIKRIRNAATLRDYKIFVSGTIEDSVDLGGTGTYDLPITSASSITIEGLSDNSGSDPWETCRKELSLYGIAVLWTCRVWHSCLQH